MLKSLSIKAKLLLIVICAVLFVSIAITVDAVWALNNQSKESIQEVSKSTNQLKEEELANYVSLAMSTINSYYKRSSKENMEKEVQEILKNQTNSLFSSIEAIYKKYKDTLKPEELKELIQTSINAARYDHGIGYFTISTIDGVIVDYPINPKLNGKDMINFKDENGKEFFKEFRKLAKGKGNGFVDYIWINPKNKKVELKVSYIKVFKPYNWIIFTGKYVSDITTQLKKEALKAVEDIRFGKTGYFFVLDKNLKMLMHPIKSSLVGKDMKNAKDPSGKYFFREVAQSLKKDDSGMVDYVWDKPGESNLVSKKLYVKEFEPWKLVVATGVYTDDLKENIAYLKKKNADSLYSSIISIVIIMLILVAIVSFILLILINKNIIKPLKNFEVGILGFFKYLDKESDTVEYLNISSNDEIGRMSKVINGGISKTKSLLEQDNDLINDVTRVVQKVKNGHLDSRVVTTTQNEELQKLQVQINNMLDNLEKQVGQDINEISKALSSYAKKDFTYTLDSSTSGNIGKEIMLMNEMITNMLQDSQKNGFILRSSAENLTNNVATLSNNARSQAASLEESVAAIDEITSNIEQTSQKARQMQSISNETKTYSQNGKKLANDTATSMDEINTTVININEAISVIDQISFQTNILSLNAAVEAATAGEAGKGFAVVAQEVRNLASRSAEAAKDIKNLVQEAIEKADVGKNISINMIDGFNTLEDRIVQTSTLIEDVTSSSTEQSNRMRQISDAVGLLDKFTQENAAVADQANQIAQDTKEIANAVANSVAKNNFMGKENR